MDHARPFHPAPESEPGTTPIGVLIVDDEPMIRELAQRTLQRGGFVVHQAENGRVAIEKLEANPGAIMLVLLDLTMPGLTGEQTLSVIRARWPAVRVVLMSGHNVQGTESFRAQGVIGFIEKPYLPHELLHIVENSLSL